MIVFIPIKEKSQRVPNKNFRKINNVELYKNTLYKLRGHQVFVDTDSNIIKGNINYANKLLGRYWSIEGVVERGHKRGRQIGFPTCNLDLKNYIIPKLGVYSSKVILDKKNKKRGIVNIGYKPTFGKNRLILEAHIFGLNKNLYDKRIKIMLIKFIRKEKKFKNIVHLKKQIKKDIRKAKLS